jgi:hypothetical protein
MQKQTLTAPQIWKEKTMKNNEVFKRFWEAQAIKRLRIQPLSK